MKLLIDANLSYRLAKRVWHLFDEVLHVERTGLPIPAPDLDIWKWAKDHDYLLVLTRDEDFSQIQELRGFPPKIIILRIENRSTEYVAGLLERHYDDILELVNDEEQGLLEIFEH